jgi:hypothetical protein
VDTKNNSRVALAYKDGKPVYLGDVIEVLFEGEWKTAPPIEDEVDATNFLNHTHTKWRLPVTN